MSFQDLKEQKKYDTGLVCGCFDIIHPGYVKLFADAKSVCKKLTVALHEDPSIERSHKLKPVLSVEERKLILAAIKYIDEIVVYRTEADLYDILQSDIYSVRILGSDYRHVDYNGKNLNRPVHWHTRAHSYSSTSLKKQIAKSLGEP